jgi:hypothetical protein
MLVFESSSNLVGVCEKAFCAEIQTLRYGEVSIILKIEMGRQSVFLRPIERAVLPKTTANV